MYLEKFTDDFQNIWSNIVNIFSNHFVQKKHEVWRENIV